MSMRVIEEEINEEPEDVGDKQRYTTTINGVQTTVDAIEMRRYSLTQSFYDNLQFEDSFEIDPDQLAINKNMLLGQGRFTEVYKGEMTQWGETLNVAVKVLKEGLDSETEQMKRNILTVDLLIMYGLQKSGGHPNVLRLAGAITTIPNEFYVITEYCNLGSLAQFLQEKNSEGLFENELILEENEQDPESRKQTWKSVQEWAWKDGFHSRRENKQITTSDLLWFALQIARAMHFLTEKKIYTHGVALRNVLLKSDFTLKVAEFGLSHSLCETDDDCQMMKDNMASSVRYMAPEMLATLECTTSSECWSFGIALWELFTFAAHEPYSKEMENAASDGSLWSRMESFLKAGGRLVIPNTIPENLKNLITDLWHEDSTKRPSFQTCEKVLRKELMHSCPRILESEQMITTPTPSMYGLCNDNLEKLNEKESKIPCRISVFKVFLLIVLLGSAFFTVYMASIRPRKISSNPEIYTASNNEHYQFLFQWNITVEELAEMTEKGRASNVYGNDLIRNWTPQYAAISGSRAHIELLLYYSGDDQVWIVKAIFEARNTTSAVNFLFSINSDRWMSRGESIKTSNFMPNSFDRSLFLDGIVNMRIYWSIVSSADSDLEYGKIVLPFLENPALSTCCPRGWYLISKSNTCARVETQKMTWFNANRSCTQQGGRLASIRNDTDNQFLLTLMTVYIKTNDTNVWLGGRTNIAVSGNSKNWFWTDGSDFTTYENWADGLPDNSNRTCIDEECLALGSWNKKWNDNCCLDEYASVCARFIRNLITCR